MVIGVGGLPSLPDEVYVVPLTKLTAQTISKDELQAYRKMDLQKGFFWDFEADLLK